MMNFSEFLDEMADLLEVDVEELNGDYELNDENFDSVVVVSTIALIDEHFSITVNGKELAEAETVGTVLNLIKKAKSV